MLYNMCYVILYNICYGMLYNVFCYVIQGMLFNIRYVIQHMLNVMLCYTTYVI